MQESEKVLEDEEHVREDIEEKVHVREKIENAMRYSVEDTQTDVRAREQVQEKKKHVREEDNDDEIYIDLDNDDIEEIKIDMKIWAMLTMDRNGKEDGKSCEKVIDSAIVLERL